MNGGTSSIHCIQKPQVPSSALASLIHHRIPSLEGGQCLTCKWVSGCTSERVNQVAPPFFPLPLSSSAFQCRGRPGKPPSLSSRPSVSAFTAGLPASLPQVSPGSKAPNSSLALEETHSFWFNSPRLALIALPCCAKRPPMATTPRMGWGVGGGEEVGASC